MLVSPTCASDSPGGAATRTRPGRQNLQILAAAREPAAKAPRRVSRFLERRQMDTTEYRLAIDEKRDKRTEHRQAEDVGRRAVDRVEQPAAAGSLEVAAILLAEHGISRPRCAQMPPQHSLGSSVGDGHLAAVSLVVDLDPVQMPESDRIGRSERREYTRQGCAQFPGRQFRHGASHGSNVTVVRDGAQLATGTSFVIHRTSGASLLSRSTNT